MEGGKRYLVHWRGRTVAQATWEPAAVLGELVGEFEAAVRRAAPSRRRPARPPPLARARARRRSLTSPFPPWQVRKTRAVTAAALRAGRVSLAELGIPATLFQGLSSRGPDGSERKPAPVLPPPRRRPAAPRPASRERRARRRRAAALAAGGRRRRAAPGRVALASASRRWAVCSSGA